MDSIADDARQDRAVLRRLDVLIHLLLEGGAAPSATTTDKVLRLLSFGLSDAETAAIIGRPPKYVTAIKSRKR